MRGDKEVRIDPVRVTLRTATQEDAVRLHSWRNDPRTVRMSHAEGRVEWEEHVEWLNGVLDDPGRTLWIAEDDGEPVGQVRADWDVDECELSWTVAPEHRQQGYGVAIVQAALDQVRAGGRKGRFVARIKAANVPSKKIAERVGLECVGETEASERWEGEI